MSGPEKNPIEVYYNSACPVCDAGVRNQQRVMDNPAASDANWIDMTKDGNALKDDSLSLDHVRRHIFVRDAEGRLHRGADAFAVLFEATPGRRWIGRMMMLPGLRGLSRLLYDWFADRLYSWNKRHGRW